MVGAILQVMIFTPAFQLETLKNLNQVSKIVSSVVVVEFVNYNCNPGTNLQVMIFTSASQLETLKTSIKLVRLR